MSDEHIIPLKDPVCQRFRMFRETIGKSQEALAKEMKQPVKLVKSIEEGKQMPSIICMIYFRETYNLDLNWLLTGAPTLADQEKFIEGLPPILVKEYCKEKKIPVKEEYEELLKLLQIPGVYHLIIAKLTEAKNVFRNEIKAHIRSGKLEPLNG
jgi:transcriptional regulator with XRE-family HTH domain